MKTLDKILEYIKLNGSCNVKMLASEFGLTTMAVRLHLQQLEEQQLLAFEDVKAKVGRPTRYWQLTPTGHQRFSDNHSDLLVQLIDSVETVFGHDGLSQVVEKREQQSLKHYQQGLAGLHSLSDRLEKLTAMRKQEGYMAQLLDEDGAFILVENHCPICKAATRCPSLCQSELSIFQQLLGEHVLIERSEHIIAGERRCAYRIQPK